MDRFSKKRRSEIMQMIPVKNTAPEMLVRSIVHRLGYRYRLHYSKLPGKPDLAFPGRKRVIFVHGCFWHGHGICRKGQLPKTNLEYWQPKIKTNKERDERNIKEIVSRGWEVLVIWMCELKNKNLAEATNKIVNFLDG